MKRCYVDTAWKGKPVKKKEAVAKAPTKGVRLPPELNVTTRRGCSEEEIVL